MKPSDVRILAVDDDPFLLESVAELFRVFKFVVETASSGNAAWAMMQSSSFNLVLTDIRMPNGDGVDLAKKIKQRHPTQTSVLFISGFSDLLAEEIFHYGVEGFFSKPFDANAIKSAIQACLLAPESKWSTPIPNGTVTELKARGEDLSALEKPGTVVFGRGGLFIGHAFVPPAKGSFVKFSVEIGGPEKTKFEGGGVVKWSQNYARPGAPAGVGIEIKSMAPEMSRQYVKLFGQRIAYIPSPRRQLNSEAS